MNWLHPLSEQIRACRDFPDDQRELLILWVNELSAICDSLVPAAPKPELAALAVMQVSWSVMDRYFALGVTNPMHPVVVMLHLGSQHRIENPSHPELRRAVECLFDGWKP